MHRPVRARRAMSRSLAVLIGLRLLSGCGSGTATPAPGSDQPSAGATSASGAPSGRVPSVPASGGPQVVPFQTGSATLKLTGSETASVTLKEIPPQDTFSGWNAVEGTTVVWRESSKGWYLSLSGFYGTGDQKTSERSFVSVTAPDARQAQDTAGACTAHVKTLTAGGFEGSFDCAGLAWQDENGDPSGPPFNATGTFSAAP